MATTTYSDMTAASTLHDEDVFAVDQPSENKSKKVSLAQVAEYVDTEVVSPAVASEETRAAGVEEGLAKAIEDLDGKKANLIKVPRIKTLAEAAAADVLSLITFDTSGSPGVPASAGSIEFSDNSRLDVDAAGEMTYTSAESVITDIYTGGTWKVSSLNTGTSAVSGVSGNSGGAWEKGTWNAGTVTVDLADLKQLAETIKAKAGDNIDLTTVEKDTLVGAVNELVNTKLDKKTIYPDTSWEWFKPEADGGGHWYWDFSTSTLRFEGFNNDSSSPIVWERYSISGGAPNFQITGGSRIGARLIVAWDSGTRGQGTLRTYYTTNKATSAFTDEDEITSRDWVRTLIAGEAGKPLPAAADHDALLDITGMKVNDWVYVEDDTHTPEGQTDPVHAGETWAYAYDGDEWVELVRINEVQIQDDGLTIEIDPVSGKRRVKSGGIGATQLAAGAATDNVIGKRQVEDNQESDTLPAAETGFTLTQWLQMIRDNSKFAFNRFARKVDGVTSDTDKNIALFERITAQKAQELIDDPDLAVPGKKYYVPETGDMFIEGPDYAKQETINRISITTGSGSWTADRDGYVTCGWTKADGSYNSHGVGINIAGKGVYGSTQFQAAVTLRILSGQTIVMNASGTITNCSCYFIPSIYKAVKANNIQVDVAPSYSLAEQPLMQLNSDGTITPKTWVDGRPIYRKSYTGTWGSTGDRALVVESSFITNNSVNEVIRFEGTARGDSNYIVVPLNSSYRNAWAVIGYGADVRSNGDLTVFAGGISSAAYTWRLTVEYTKTS
jgi:hypothetical protein